MGVGPRDNVKHNESNRIENVEQFPKITSQLMDVSPPGERFGAYEVH